MALLSIEALFHWIRRTFRSPEVLLALGALGIMVGITVWERVSFFQPYYTGEPARREQKGSGAPALLPWPDATQTINALPDAFFSALTREAEKPRLPGTLTLLTTEYISPADLVGFLGMYPEELPPFWTGGIHLYLWTPKETEGKNGTAARSAIVAILPYYEEELPRHEDLFRKTLLEHAPMLLTGHAMRQSIQHGFTPVMYRGVTVNYINMPTPDTALDYAFMPERKFFIFAASREAMQATIDRIRNAE